MYNILVCDDEKDIVSALKIYLDRLKQDKVIMNGYRVSDFAISALERAGSSRCSRI